MAIRRILVPIDFSKDSLKSLEYARQFAKPFKAELLLLFVVEPVYYASPVDMYAGSANVAVLADEQQQVAEQHLAALSASLTKKDQPHRTLVKRGPAAEQIVDTARRSKADMIVMATHGRTGLAHMLLGSVAERVVRSARCPVVTLRHGAAPKTARRGRHARSR